MASPYITLLIGLALTFAACSGPAPVTCGVPGATQTCLCAGGISGAQICQPGGAWGVCDCSSSCQGDTCGDTSTDTSVGPDTSVPAECEGVVCHNGGACVLEDGEPACDCASGFFGGDCKGVCESERLAVAACSTVVSPDQWTTIALGPDGQPLCVRPQAFEFAPDSPATEVRLVLGLDTDGNPDNAAYESFDMSDPDGDGTWQTALVLEGGTYWVGYLVGNTASISVSQLTIPACDQELEAPACGRLFDGNGAFGLLCSEPGAGCGVASECPGGCVDDYWFGMFLDAPKTVTRLRFRSDWWKKRPVTWELWASDDPSVTPGQGARLVASGAGAEAPWECVTGEPCDDPAIPEACCPNGRDQPQAVNDNSHIPKWESYAVDDARGRSFFLRVVSAAGDGQQLIMEEVELEGHGCAGTSGTFALPECAPFEPDSGACGADQWCSAAGGPDGATAVCAPVGAGEEESSCVQEPCELGADQCMELRCRAGLICASSKLCRAMCDPADPAATCTDPGRPFCVGETSGDATLPWGTCTPPPCSQALAPDECPTGMWCSPATDPSPACVPFGSGALGDPCDGPTDCGDSQLCVAGTCLQLCDPTLGVGCPGATECVTPPFESIGSCEETCDYDAGDDCGPGRFCKPHEKGSLAVDVCKKTPSGWPDDDGLDPYEVCASYMPDCAPFSACYSTGPDEPPVCVPLCRPELGPYGAPTHPDCPAGAPACVDAGLGDVGACIAP